MPHRTGVTVQTGRTVGACLIAAQIDGEVVFMGELSWSLDPLGYAELLREYLVTHAASYRAARADGPSSSHPQPDPAAELRLMA